MNTWTLAAKDELEKYLAAIRRPLEQAGADAAEVMEDLKRHLDEEISLARLQVVTVTDLKPMLARIGEPSLQWEPARRSMENDHRNGIALHERGVIEPPPRSKPPSDAPRKNPTGPAPAAPGWLLFICAVVYPAATFAIEWVTGFCAARFFNPIPTWGHVLIVASVPLVNGLVWWALREGREAEWARYLGWLSSFAIGISFVYTLIFLPLVLPALIMVLFGIGLLPLAPAATLAAAISLRSRLKQRLAYSNQRPLPGLWAGVTAAALLFLLVDFPFVGSTVALQMAARAKPESKAVDWLRSFGNERTLLRACYPGSRNSSNFALLYWLLPKEYQVTTEQAQRVYFQVYGRAFNSVAAPGPRAANLLAPAFLEPWDPERGGEKVGSPVHGLVMQTSRMDATVEPNAAISYLEWILEFRNDSGSQVEARSDVLLPPGAVVSRLTLWINGEEREAAFAGKSQVRQAYENIVAQRRDPVLVTTSGKDSVLVQCFPVPANGGIMKVRIGVTVPLQLDAEKNGILRWPVMRQRNFALDEKLDTTFWLDSPTPMESLEGSLKVERTQSGHYLAHGNLSEQKNPNLQPAIRVSRAGAADTAWVRDTRGDEEALVIQTLRAVQKPIPQDVVLVIDGSASLERLAPALASVPIPTGRSWKVVVAAETTQEYTVSNSDEWTRMVTSLKFVGGQDNLPALARAWDLAAENGSGAVIWLHGPQPIIMSSAEGFRQRLERRRNAVEFHDLQVERGANVMATILPAHARWQTVSLHLPVDQTLAGLLSELSGERTRYEAHRERVEIAKAPSDTESSLHLARAWAFDEINRLVALGRRTDAVKIAGAYQLVTEVSGAVVLETAEQFKNAGLQPVDAATVPTVPEPGTWALLILGGLVLGWRRFFRRAA